MRDTVRNLGGGARRGISVVAPGEGLRRHAPRRPTRWPAHPWKENQAGAEVKEKMERECRYILAGT
jgi:hypothetical protein